MDSLVQASIDRTFKICVRQGLISCMNVRVKRLNDLPGGRRAVICGKFLIFSADAVYQVTGNRVKLKRAWKRWDEMSEAGELDA